MSEQAESGVYINGRFLVQPLSGVQRFATEVTVALNRVWPESVPYHPQLLVPPQAGTPIKLPLKTSEVGRYRGQIWEQIELPRYVQRRSILINLGNTAPIFVRRQIVVIHDTGIFTQPKAYSWKFKLWYRFLQKVLTLNGSRIVTVSEFSKSELVRFLGVHASAVDVVPEGADHMQRVTTDNSVLQMHGLQAGRFVLAVGNLSAHKNLSALNETARMLAERDMTLVVTGGFDSSVFQKGTALPSPATYVGRVSDEQLSALYRAAACFVFPSLYEGFGLPAIEAMSCGCSVVASAIPALGEVCGEAALYADPADPEDIARQVMRLVNDAELQTEMRHKASIVYTWDAAASALALVAKEMLDSLS